MLTLDGLEGVAPTIWIVLTTREATTDPKRFWRSREQVWKAIRRRWPEAEYAGLCEFTTGYGRRSGGARRPHWNLAIKGVPLDDQAELAALVRRIWCEREDAEPWAQHVQPIHEVGGLMRYITLHFLKESQAPPHGWRGHRFIASRGYFEASYGMRSRAREAARASLRERRRLWRALQMLGGHGPVPADIAELVVEQLREVEEARRWELVRLRVGGEVTVDAR